jgi:hypothetical protein
LADQTARSVVGGCDLPTCTGNAGIGPGIVNIINSACAMEAYAARQKKPIPKEAISPNAATL